MSTALERRRAPGNNPAATTRAPEEVPVQHAFRLALLCVPAAGCLAADGGDLRIAGLGGVRTFDAGEIDEVYGDSTAYGVTAAALAGGFGIESTWLRAAESTREGGVDADLTVDEFSAGLRQEFFADDFGLRPFVAAGALYANVDSDTDLGDDSDTTFGGYVSGGVDFQLPFGLFVGAAVHYVFLTELQLSDESTDIDGLTYLGRLGWAL